MKKSAPLSADTFVPTKTPLTLKELEYACAVAQHTHFGRAAEACHVSQPTLSAQLRKLENTLGLQLFERGREGVKLTREGAPIIALAEQVLDGAAAIHRLAQTNQDPLVGALSLGLIPTIAPPLIPRFARPMTTDLPRLSVTYSEDVTERLEAALLDGTLDAAILATPPGDSHLSARALYREPFYLILPQAHPIASRTRVSMDELESDDVMLLSEGHCFRDQALSICRPAHLRRRQSVRATSLETLVNLCAAGHGMTFMPALSIDRAVLARQKLAALPLSDEGAARDIVITTRNRFPNTIIVDRIASIIQHSVRDADDVQILSA